MIISVERKAGSTIGNATSDEKKLCPLDHIPLLETNLLEHGFLLER